MISSFFSKTKPINYLVLSFSVVLFYVIHFFFSESKVNFNLLYILVLVAIILQIIGVQEIVRLRKITNTSSFAMLFFVLLCISIPKIIHFKEVVFCNLFLILSLNRVLALKTITQIKNKVFDATLWICVASLFDSSALFFLIVVFLAVYVYGTKEFRTWLVPFVAIIIFILLSSTFLVLNGTINFFQNHYRLLLEKNFLEGFNKNFSIKPFLYVLVILCLVLVVFIKQGYQGIGRIVHLRLLLVYFSISIFLFAIKTAVANNHVILFYSFFPAAIFATNFIETFKKKRLKELLLIGCILFPLLLLLMDLNKK